MDTSILRSAPGQVNSPTTLARVPFRGGFIEATQLDGEVWVPIRPVCEALGLAWQPQLKKLRAKPWANTCDTFMVSEGDDQRRRFSCVDLRSLPLWLATIEPSRVKPEAREALVAYQREAAEVLFKHFLAAPSPAPAGAALGADVGAKLNETRAKLAEAMWALGLPAREGAELDPASAEAMAE
ncbi:MAG TPA: phage antirepressor N-terminal domain-containing protein, partial [Myxococcota bacterium]|nr:phage antirepressor N-terminal domain-containing protein [Myxococcota bacterium]